VPLESCPVCGYALSAAAHRCLHCGYVRGGVSDRRTLEKHLTTVVVLLVVLLLGVLSYIVFFHH